ncbi:MAG: type II secretion system F family protein [Phycisphaerae bacterium]
MPTFVYRARNSGGESVNGTLVADTQIAAARMLDERALLPIELSELKTQQRSFLTGGTRRISLSKVGIIYEQLADLLKAGVPVLRALSVLAKQSTAGLTRVLREVHESVSGGDTLADAMDKHPEAFPSLHVSMIRAGEKGGFLEDVLTRLSEFVARQDALKNKFIGAMVYPCILLLGGLSAITTLMAYVVPKIRGLLEQRQLPIVTHIVFAISDVISNHYLELLGGLTVLIVAVVGFVQSRAGKTLLSQAQLRAPVVGRVFTMIALCRFCRIFGTLLANGIPILQALKISKDSTGNEILSDSIERAAESVRGGESLTVPLAASRVFPPAMIDMIAVAEESNTLEKVLVEIADTQEERTARQIELAVRLIEPLMLLFMGLMVMTIAVALLLPILSMASSGLRPS